MKQITGNLITLANQGQFNVIIHGCNCFCTMNNGIAPQIKKEYPEAYAADLLTIKGDKNKLGTFSHASVLRGEHEITIVNAYTQYNYGHKKQHLDYEALEQVMQRIALEFPHSSIGYPKIGAGLAQGDWGLISGIINDTLVNLDHTLVNYDKEVKNEYPEGYITTEELDI